MNTITKFIKGSPKRLPDDTHIFGFWVYLMSDLIIFAVLFAAYAVLQGNSFGGPTPREIFGMPNALAETLVLLSSSFTCGLALIASQGKNVKRTIAWLIATFALGGTFLALELTEFARLAASGAGWQRSAFLSSFFTLVGTHGLHITIGLLWIVIAVIQLSLRGLTPAIRSKLMRFALFWHFLDIVWIFIFTMVYLLGHAG